MLRRLHILACAKVGSCAIGPFSVGYTMSISGHLRALTEFLRTTGISDRCTCEHRRDAAASSERKEWEAQEVRRGAKPRDRRGERRSTEIRAQAKTIRLLGVSLSSVCICKQATERCGILSRGIQAIHFREGLSECLDAVTKAALP
jgi:hypothetical protein